MAVVVAVLHGERRKADALDYRRLNTHSRERQHSTLLFAGMVANTAGHYQRRVVEADAGR